MDGIKGVSESFGIDVPGNGDMFMDSVVCSSVLMSSPVVVATVSASLKAVTVET
jgi:hypothetical protein